MSNNLSYEDACRYHATAQGLDPLTEALTKAGIEHQVLQTGGFCMVVEIAIPGTDFACYGVTYEPPDGFWVVRYEDWRDYEELGMEVMSGATPETIIDLVRCHGTSN